MADSNPSSSASSGLSSRLQGLTRQFQGLNPSDPAAWPTLPRYLLLFLVAALVVIGLWFAWVKQSDERLASEREKEAKLRQDYTKKLAQAIVLDALKKQREQVLQYVTQLEKQLPSKAEMDALLSDINQAGLGRSLQFELFRPGQVSVKEYYAELPISIRVTGRYHDIGSFTSDIAQLSRIVTLHNLNLVPGRDGSLVMDATVRTYRYLDMEEVAAQRKAGGAPGKK